MGNILFKDCSENKEIENLNYYKINYKTTPGPPILKNDTKFNDNTCTGCCKELR